MHIGAAGFGAAAVVMPMGDEGKQGERDGGGHECDADSHSSFTIQVTPAPSISPKARMNSPATM